MMLYIAVAAGSSGVTDAVLFSMLKDDRLAARAPEVEGAMLAALTALEEVSDEVWGLLATGCRCPADALRAECV
eukprot:4847069-Pyramimonas_sp.AAC.1